MSMLWMGGLLQQAQDQPLTRPSVDGKVESTNVKVRELEHHVARLSLLNQALWELIRERLNVTDADLEKRIHEVDLRDGVEDGCITDGPLQCPTCGRVSNSKHWKCLYCGQAFERPAMA